MNDSEIEKEAERLGWTVEQLKEHWAKEERITRLSDEKREKKSFKF